MSSYNSLCKPTIGGAAIAVEEPEGALPDLEENEEEEEEEDGEAAVLLVEELEEPAGAVDLWESPRMSLASILPRRRTLAER